MTYARRVDRNHGEIVDALRRTGWVVLDCSRLGQGAPDLVVAKGLRVVACEVKSAKGKLRPGQTRWLSDWPGETAVLRSVEDVLRMGGER